MLPRIYPRVYEGLRRRYPALLCHSIKGAIQRSLLTLGAEVVLSAYPAEDFFVAGFLAARELHLPVYAYLHEIWEEDRPAESAKAHFAKKWEPVILREATRVICMTEPTQQYYKKKYGIETDLLPHSIAEDAYLDAPTELLAPQTGNPTVLFVGGINPKFNADALKVLAAASELLPEEYELVFSTPADMRTLDHFGIHSSRLRVTFVDRQELYRFQSKAHVLIVPLSHKNCAREDVRTVFSTKLLDYFLAGRPIIVFAPEDSYHAVSATKQGWGYVVTEDSPQALATAIVKVIEDQVLAAQLVQGALREAGARRSTLYATRLQEWVAADTK